MHTPIHDQLAAEWALAEAMMEVNKAELESIRILTAFVCMPCRIGNHPQCKGRCDCQHRKEVTGE